jgi:hypothetical protein
MATLQLELLYPLYADTTISRHESVLLRSMRSPLQYQDRVGDAPPRLRGGQATGTGSRAAGEGDREEGEDRDWISIP